jgi:hypothetical protein
MYVSDATRHIETLLQGFAAAGSLGQTASTDTSKFGTALGATVNTTNYNGATLGATSNTADYP